MKRCAAGCLALAGLLLTGSGCTRQAARPAAPAHWQLTLTVNPAVPRQLDPVQFQIRMKKSDGSPVTGTAVTVNLFMPGMDMGQNEAAAQENPGGVYTAASRFTMPGDWQVTVHADKGALHQAQSFPVTVH